MTWEPIALVVSLWFAIGMTCASSLYRRGHDGWHWTLARWAGENAPAAIVTTRRAHHPRTLGRLTRLAAEHPGVSVLVLDPASLAAGAARAA